jgi:hypothetical protein
MENRHAYDPGRSHPLDGFEVMYIAEDRFWIGDKTTTEVSHPRQVSVLQYGFLDTFKQWQTRYQA